jgi:hypothetical protein
MHLLIDAKDSGVAQEYHWGSIDPVIKKLPED